MSVSPHILFIYDSFFYLFLISTDCLHPYPSGGLENQIQELREVIELPLTRPELFQEMGIQPQKGKNKPLRRDRKQEQIVLKSCAP